MPPRPSSNRTPSRGSSGNTKNTPRSGTRTPAAPADPMEEIYKDPKRFQEFYNEFYDNLQQEKANFDECSFVFLNTKRPLEPIVSLQTSTEELFYGSYDGPIRCFSTANGKRTQTLRGHSSLISGLELVQKTKVLEPLGIEVDHVEEEQGIEEKKDALKSRNDVILFSSSRDGTVRCWDLNKSKTIKSYTTNDGAPRTCMKVCLSPSSPALIASGGLDGSIVLWDMKSAEVSCVYSGHASQVSTLDYADSKLYSGSLDSFVKIIDVEKQEAISIIRPTTQPIRSLCVNGTDIFVGSSSGIIYQYDARTSEQVGQFKGHTDSVLCTRIYDTNYLLSGSEDTFVVLWDIKTKEMIHVYGGHKDSVMAISITDEDKSVYSGSLDKTIRRWGASSAITLVKHEKELIEHKKRLEELIAKTKPKPEKTR